MKPQAEEIERDLREFFDEKLYSKRSSVSLEEPLENTIDLDSLNLMLLSFHLENKYGLRLQKEDLAPRRFKTLGDLIQLVLLRVTQKDSSRI